MGKGRRRSSDSAAECRGEACPVDLSAVDIFSDLFPAEKKKEMTPEELEKAKERIKILLEKVEPFLSYIQRYHVAVKKEK